MIRKVVPIILIGLMSANVAIGQFPTGPSPNGPTATGASPNGPPATGATPNGPPATGASPAAPAATGQPSGGQPSVNVVSDDLPRDERDDREPVGIAYEAPAKPSLHYEKDAVLVVYEGLPSYEQVEASADETHHSLRAMYYFDEINLALGAFTVRNQTLPKAIDHFRDQAIVSWTQPNYFYETANTNVQQPPINWTIHYGLKSIGLDRYIGSARGAGVTIGLIDSVVQLNHPEFSGQQITQHNILNIGQADIHGTAIASILLGGKKIPGIVPAAKLVSIPAFGKEPFSNIRRSETERLAQALNAMMKQSVDVVNLSFSGQSDPLIHVLLSKMMDKGILLVAAAGNGGQSAAPSFPAAYSGIMSITAVDKNLQVYGHANRGDYIDLSAPGVKILAATKNSSYGLVTGTSFATAYTTGLAALLKSQGNNNAAIESLLTRTVKDLGAPGKDANYGYGLMQAP